jgi:MFS family permease
MICVAIFTISSFLCGIAPSLGALIFFRVLQGIGGGALQPISQAILVESFPREKQGMAMAVYGMGVVVAPVVGPTLGGWITDNYSWRWIFFINIPVGILSLVLTALLIFDPPFLKRKSLGNGFKIDYMGFGLLALGLGALEVVMDEGQKEDWFGSHFIVTFAVITVVCLVAVVFWELRQKEPIIDFHAGAWVRSLRQHRAHAPFPANAARLHRHDERSGAVARRIGDGCLFTGCGHHGAQVSAAVAGNFRGSGHVFGFVPYGQIHSGNRL